MQLELFNPHHASAAIDLADALFKRWTSEVHREETWAKLQKCINELGPACQWNLPARLRLVAIIVQVTELFHKVHVQLHAGLWVLKVRRQKYAHKIDALGLMGGLAKCLECSESPDLTAQEKAELASLSTEQLETEVVAAASIISSNLEYHSLEDRHILAVKAKEFKLAETIIHELELLWKFLQISAPMPILSDISANEIKLAPRARDDNTLSDLLAKELSQDDTLEDMLELSAEGEDLEDVMTPLSQTSHHLRTVAPPLIGKRKAEVAVVVPNSAVRKRQVPASHSSIATSQTQVVLHPTSRSGSQASRVSDIFNSALSERREERATWTPEAEERLMNGHTRYGNRWEFIRSQCQLQQYTGSQLKDKVRTLKKQGRL